MASMFNSGSTHIHSEVIRGILISIRWKFLKEFFEPIIMEIQQKMKDCSQSNKFTWRSENFQTTPHIE